MTENHPITPPPNLVQEWYHEADNQLAPYYVYIATQAARWGADQELEACCHLLRQQGFDVVDDLRATRRPKPPSLKERALGALYAIATGADDTREFHQDLETIKSALEQLDD